MEIIQSEFIINRDVCATEKWFYVQKVYSYQILMVNILGLVRKHNCYLYYFVMSVAHAINLFLWDFFKKFVQMFRTN